MRIFSWNLQHIVHMLHALMINNMFAYVFSALTNLKAYHSYNMAHLQRSFARSNSSCSHRTHTHTHSGCCCRCCFGPAFSWPILLPWPIPISIAIADCTTPRKTMRPYQRSGRANIRAGDQAFCSAWQHPKKKVACNMQQAMGKSLAMLRVKTRIGIINNVQCYSS